MFAQYSEYYGIILREAVFSWTHCIAVPLRTVKQNSHEDSQKTKGVGLLTVFMISLQSVFA